ncbi:cytochrome c biogenesis protein ResB [Risungbinella massiliensis]|uniref:cytochrome c biogenesis protein ResB n=1 Tax=Risungbinella massiliensis TaxID=1329796 RepID=UPI0009E64C24|nr:cytochrome c biogenesis protein ResB [Risungbinella massiliensis]
MLEDTKCECGHNNPVGTILCEYCGKPLEEEPTQFTDREMRYDGTARKSQKAVKSPFDQVWTFFSSVKVAVTLIIITFVLSILGTIYPLEKFIPSTFPETYYLQTYGYWGDLFYRLGFTNMYSSWWFVALLAMIGISLVVCSLDRVVPLYKALKNQKVKKSTSFLERQRIAYTYEDSIPSEKVVSKWKDVLQKQRYQVHVDGENLLAEKGRLSRWGPYINHIGLILFLFAIVLRYIPGWNVDEYVWVREGETKKVPGTKYYIHNEKAEIEFYDPNAANGQAELNANDTSQVVKKYRTTAVIYEKDPKTGQLQEAKRHAILVNEPLGYKGTNLYQSDFRQNQLKAIQFEVVDKKTGQVVGTFTSDLYDLKPNQKQAVGDRLESEVLEYYPEFEIVNGTPQTKTQEPNKPAFIFRISEKGTDYQEVSWVISGERFPNPETNRYEIQLKDFEFVNSSGLMVRVEKSWPLYLFGGTIFMIGLIMGSYFQHRRIWLQVKDGKIYFGAHTNKNWYGLRRDLQQISNQIGLNVEWIKKS